MACLGATLYACNGAGSSGSSAQVEKLPDIKPNLPSVPTLPPPPHPVTYPDQSYSVFGLRKKSRATIDSSVSVTGYIVEIYHAPACKKNEPCPKPVAPHTWMADTPNETDPSKRLRLVGYAMNQSEVDEAVAKAKRGQYKPPPAETGLAGVPTDFAVGNRVNVNGRFTRVSSSGFNQSDGVLEYSGHTTLSQ
jgi:hypothetical protein